MDAKTLVLVIILLTEMYALKIVKNAQLDLKEMQMENVPRPKPKLYPVQIIMNKEMMVYVITVKILILDQKKILK